MKPQQLFYKLFSLFILSFCSLQSVAQGESTTMTKTKATYEKEGNFRLKYFGETGSISCTIKAKYDNENHKVEVFFVREGNGEKNDSSILKMKEPFNYAYFHQKFNDAINIQTGQTAAPKTLDDNSIQAVFNMVYMVTIGDDDDLVMSGEMGFRKWAKIRDGDFDYGQGTYKTDQIGGILTNSLQNQYSEDSLINIMNGFETYLQSKKATVDTFLSKGEKKTIGYLDLYITDTVMKSKRLQEQQSSYNSANTSAQKIKDEIIHLQSLIQSDSVKKLDLNLSVDTEKIKGIKKDDSTYQSRKETLKKWVIEIENLLLIPTQNEIDTSQKILRTSINNLTQYYSSNIKINNTLDQIKKIRKNWSDNYYKNIEGLKKAQIEELKVLDSPEIKSLYGAGQEYFDEYSRYEGMKAAMRSNSLRQIKKVSLQFERGYLERIQVWISNGYSEDIYENIYAIGMTSINNFKSFTDVRLFIRKSSKMSGNYIFLSDVISNYNNFLSEFTRDYSPGDTTINGIDPVSTPMIQLRKERLVNLFDSKIYTDLAGLKQGQPNGLIQLEASRRFNVYTQRFQAKRTDFGFVNYINAYGALTKIEQTEKYLSLKNAGVVQNGRIISPSYATNLDYRQYENFSLGVDANLFLFDWPDAKFTLFVDIGYRYGHTPVVDTPLMVDGFGNVTSESTKPTFLDAHTFTWELPKVRFELFSERRVGLTLSYQFNITNLYSNNQFKQVVSYDKSDVTQMAIESNAKRSHMFEFLLKVETSRSGNGRTFLRARYYKQVGDANTFFPQIQVGYAYNLIFRK